MSILSATVIIHLPIEEVFSFISDYHNDWKWRSRRIDFLNINDTDPTLLMVKQNYFPLFNQKINTRYKLIDYTQNRYIISQFQLGKIHITDERYVTFLNNHSTQFHSVLKIESSGIWKIFESLFTQRLSLDVANDLQWLKEMMEKLSSPLQGETNSGIKQFNANETTNLMEMI